MHKTLPGWLTTLVLAGLCTLIIRVGMGMENKLSSLQNEAETKTRDFELQLEAQMQQNRTKALSEEENFDEEFGEDIEEEFVEEE